MPTKVSVTRVEDRVYYRNPDVDRYQIPLSELGDLRMVDIPAHSHLEVLGMHVPSEGVECEMWLVNNGENLSVYGGASIGATPATARYAVARLRRAFPDVLLPGASRHPDISVADSAGRGLIAHAFLNLEFGDKSETTVREAVEPFVVAFRRLSLPDATAFICHASEDKAVVRLLAEFVEQQGVSVWLDEREIRVGDSIVQRISQGLDAASHLVVVLSSNSVAKPWVTKELSVGLMRQLDQRAITILPLRLDDAPVPVLLSDIKYADCRSNREFGFNALVDAILSHRGI